MQTGFKFRQIIVFINDACLLPMTEPVVGHFLQVLGIAISVPFIAGPVKKTFAITNVVVDFG